jgi:hypothetical protein
MTGMAALQLLNDRLGLIGRVVIDNKDLQVQVQIKNPVQQLADVSFTASDKGQGAFQG